MTPHQQLQERLNRQTEDRHWNEHRAQTALRAKQIHEQRIQDDLGLLRPGERIIDGVVHYSSMWLDDPGMSICLNCGHAESGHDKYGCLDCLANIDSCPGFRDEPTDSEMSRGHRVVDSFEGVGDFNSDDPYERYQAHRAAKG